MKRIAWGPLVLTSTLAFAGFGAGDGPKPEKPALEMSKAVVCKKIEGYEKYVELPDASLTSEDKLNVYFRPLNFRVDPVEKPAPGRRFKARFSEDCRIRRKGEKTPVMKKDKLLEYDPFFEVSDERLYLINNISLKGLAAGEYELDIVLHDVLEEGATATQSVAFTIEPISEADPKAKPEKTAEPESPAVPAGKSKKAKPTKGKP
jgi:hypothetical protein